MNTLTQEGINEETKREEGQDQEDPALQAQERPRRRGGARRGLGEARRQGAHERGAQERHQREVGGAVRGGGGVRVDRRVRQRSSQASVFDDSSQKFALILDHFQYYRVQISKKVNSQY